jgi:hypothetical protein
MQLEVGQEQEAQPDAGPAGKRRSLTGLAGFARLVKRVARQFKY